MKQKQISRYKVLIKAVWLLYRQFLTMCDSGEVACMANMTQTLQAQGHEIMWTNTSRTMREMMILISKVKTEKVKR